MFEAIEQFPQSLFRMVKQLPSSLRIQGDLRYFPFTSLTSVNAGWFEAAVVLCGLAVARNAEGGQTQRRLSHVPWDLLRVA